MITPQANEVETNSDTSGATQMTVGATGKLFEILCRKVYTDKVSAVIRELWSNAYDSHVDAGTPEVPFLASLPTALDPNFVVRDYGVGMSHDDVVNTYAVLTASTKTDSNDVVGFLGIGSKAPFAISDMFSLRCFDGTSVRGYVIYIGPEGVPVIQRTGEQESDEPRGVEVSVPVESAQFSEFASKAETVAFGFPASPIGIPDRGRTDYASGTYTTGSGVTGSWSVGNYALSLGTYSSGLYVKQGPVLYPTRLSELKVSSAAYNAHKVAGVNGYSHGTDIVVEVPIGTVSVAPDRESLSMDRETVSTLTSIMDAAMIEVFGHIEAKYDEALRLNWLNRVTRFGELNSVFAGKEFWSPVPSGEDSGKGRFGLSAGSTIFLCGGSDWDVPSFGSSRRKYGAELRVPASNTGSCHPLDQCGAGRRSQTISFVREYLHDASFVIVTGNAVRSTARVRRYVASHDRTYVVESPSAKQIERLITLLGLSRDQLVFDTDLPDIAPVKRERRAAGVSGAYVLNSSADLVSIDKLPSTPYLWARIDRKAKNAQVHVWSSETTTSVDHLRVVPLVPLSTYTSSSSYYGENSRTLKDGFLSRLGLPADIVVLTEAAVRRIKPDPSMEVHVALDRAVNELAYLPTYRVAMMRAVETYAVSLEREVMGYVGASFMEAVLTSVLTNELGVFVDPDAARNYRLESTCLSKISYDKSMSIPAVVDATGLVEKAYNTVLADNPQIFGGTPRSVLADKYGI